MLVPRRCPGEVVLRVEDIPAVPQPNLFLQMVTQLGPRETCLLEIAKSPLYIAELVITPAEIPQSACGNCPRPQRIREPAHVFEPVDGILEAEGIQEQIAQITGR